MTSAAAYAAALAALPGIGPATLVRLLEEHGPEAAWERVRSGSEGPPGRAADGPGSALSDEVAGAAVRTDGPGEEPLPGLRDQAMPARRPGLRGRPAQRAGLAWAEFAARCDPDRLGEDLRQRGIQVTWWGADTFPVVLLGDPQPPGVFFWKGELGWLERPCVAVVGTRRPTPDGRAIAFELGRDLAAAGVCVVSGLALGIDGSAHAGALSLEGAGTVGVAASGVDVPYPPRHAELWERVVAHGAVCSETPPGRPAQAWRFPVRNRVIAGLSRLVVVVESHATGGSLITAEAALARGVDVAAVPGPVRSPASAGTNQLLADGPAPVRHAGDVLDALGLFAAWPPRDAHLRPQRPPARPAGAVAAAARSASAGARSSGPPSLGVARRRVAGPGVAGPELAGPGVAGPGMVAKPVGPESPEARRVLDAVPWRPVSLNQVVERCGLPVSVVVVALDELEAGGVVAPSGAFWHRVGPA